MASTVQPLTVSVASSYVITTPFIPGVPPETPIFTLSTPLIPGFPPEETTRYSIATPWIPGVELDLDAGPDHLDETYPRKLRNRRADEHELLTVHDHQDETYLPTRITGIDHGMWHLDETYEATTLTANEAVLVSPITFPPVRRKSTVQSLTTVLYPGADQTVVFPRLPYQPGRLGVVG